jgi:tripartite-type tricarboxylate transporter receptor subunit TctC
LAFADSWPARQILLVVPFAAGSVTDIVARQVAASLHAELGRAVVVENRPGAQGLTASQLVARAAADGYTLLLASNSTHGAAPSLFTQPGYDPVKDFTAISRLASLPLVLAVGAQSPQRTLPDLLRAVRERPQEVSFGFGGTASQVAGYMLREGLRAELTPVPYKTVTDSVADVASGRVTFAFLDVPNAKAMQEAAKLRLLAVSSPARMRLFPELPAVAEAGLPGFDITGWFGLVAPAGVPREVIDRLSAALARGYATPEIRAKFASQGIEVTDSDPAEFGRFIAREVPRWAAMLRAARIERQ